MFGIKNTGLLIHFQFILTDMEWRKIVGFNNYSISSLGLVRNDRTGLILKQQFNDHGYLTVTISGIPRRVHRLVAEAFIANPHNKRTVNHKNGIRFDNYVGVLEWNTYKENNDHSFCSLGRVGSYLGKIGKDCPNHKKVYQFSFDGILINEYYGCHEAARLTGSDYRKISAVCVRKRKTHNGFIWSYENNLLISTAR